VRYIVNDMEAQEQIQTSLMLGFSLSESVRKALQARGYDSLAAFARATGRHPSQVVMCLTGQRNSYRDILEDLGAELHVNPDWLEAHIPSPSD